MSDDTQLQVDDAYLRRAILEANAELVKGYPAVMPVYTFNDQEIEALIAYIRSLAQ